MVILFILSLVESAITLASPLNLRMLLERQDKQVSALLSIVLENKMQIMVPVHLGIQVCLIVVAILTTHLCLVNSAARGVLVAFLCARGYLSAVRVPAS